MTLPGEIHYRSLKNILANDERPRGLGLPYGQGKIIRAQRYDATNILRMDRLRNIAPEDVRIVRLRNTSQTKPALGRERQTHSDFYRVLMPHQRDVGTPR